jgi:hypothetical protein
LNFQLISYPITQTINKLTHDPGIIHEAGIHFWLSDPDELAAAIHLVFPPLSDVFVPVPPSVTPFTLSFAAQPTSLCQFSAKNPKKRLPYVIFIQIRESILPGAVLIPVLELSLVPLIILRVAKDPVPMFLVIFPLPLILVARLIDIHAKTMHFIPSPAADILIPLPCDEVPFAVPHILRPLTFVFTSAGVDVNSLA